MKNDKQNAGFSFSHMKICYFLYVSYDWKLYIFGEIKVFFITTLGFKKL